MMLTSTQIGELAAQFFIAGAGTLSFAVLFGCPRKSLLFCGLVGAVGWFVYELAVMLGADSAAASLLAVIPLTLLTRVFAIVLKMPVTVFLLSGIFPLVPGAGIYYTAYYFIQGNNALALSNGCVALSGAVLAQYQGYADINTGIGIVVVGLASVIIGEVLFGRRSLSFGLFSAVLGAIVYRFIIAIVLKIGIFPAFALKLVSSIVVALALSVPAVKHAIRLRRRKKQGRKEAASC